MATPPIKAKPLSAAEFFARKLRGFSKTDAAAGAALSYSAVHDTTVPGKTARPKTLQKLQAWSLTAITAHGVYLSAAKTAEIPEPTARDIAKAG